MRVSARKPAPLAALRTIAIWLTSSLALSCVHPPPLPPAPAEPQIPAAEREANRAAAESLLVRVRQAHQKPVTVTGDAKAFVDAAENGGRYALMFAVQRPDSLHIDALLPWGEPAASLVTSQGKMAFRDDRQKKFYRGTSNPRNLSLLLPAPLADTELIALMTGSLPELPGGEASSVEDAGDGRQRLLIRTIPPGLTTLRGYTQSALIGRDLTVLEVSRFLEGGKKPELIWAATLEEQGGADVPGLPGLIHMHIAASSVGQSRDVDIDLRLKNLIADHAAPPAAFTLRPPAEMSIIELDQAR
jgi:hypothetical protein